jgi:thiamine transport system permease protein
MVWGNIGLMLLLLGAPLAALVGRSLTVAGQFSLTYYQALFAETHRSQTIFFVPPGEGILNSLIFALSTVGVSLLLGLMVTTALTIRPYNPSKLPETAPLARRLFQNPKFPGLPARTGKIRNLKFLFEAIFMLPLATSAVTLGFGYIITLNKPPLNLRTSPLLIVIAHTLIALPFVLRSLLPALRSIQPALHEAAAVLGAAPIRVWREVDLPIASRALLVGAVFAFTVSMGEFGATLFIARPETPTIPLAIFRFLDQPGPLNYGQALAMSALLMLVCAAGFVVIEHFRIGNTEF